MEVDEYNHEGRKSKYEKNRQLMTESYGIPIIRTNPDAANFDMNRLINQIYRHISQSNQEKLKKEKVNIKELEDEIKKLKLQLANLSMQNNDDKDNNKKIRIIVMIITIIIIIIIIKLKKYYLYKPTFTDINYKKLK